MTLATRVAVLRDGQLVQFDAPQHIYRKPATRFVAEFMGRPAMNTFDGIVHNGRFRTERFSLPAAHLPEGPVTIGIRPEQIEIVDANAEGALPFEVDVVELVEPDVLIFVRVADRNLIIRTPNTDSLPVHGEPVHLRFPPTALHAFDAKTGERIP